MIELGKVTEVRSGEVCIETKKKSLCDSCENASCGVGGINRLLPGKSAKIWMNTQESYHVGNHLEIELKNSALLKASALMYAIPLMSLVVCALIGQQLDKILGFFELFTVIFALGGFASSFMIIRYFLQKRNLQLHRLLNLRISENQD